MKEGIRRVVWIPKELDEEIEKTRQKIGYTRSGFYRYILTRFLEREILTKRKQVSLRPWEEVIGRLKAIEIDGQTVSAIIACIQDLDIAITYPKDTPEANIIRNLNNLLGQRIAILKTDQTLLIRELNENITAKLTNMHALIPTEVEE